MCLSHQSCQFVLEVWFEEAPQEHVDWRLARRWRALFPRGFSDWSRQLREHLLLQRGKTLSHYRPSITDPILCQYWPAVAGSGSVRSPVVAGSPEPLAGRQGLSEDTIPQTETDRGCSEETDRETISQSNPASAADDCWWADVTDLITADGNDAAVII